MLLILHVMPECDLRGFNCAEIKEKRNFKNVIKKFCFPLSSCTRCMIGNQIKTFLRLSQFTAPILSLSLTLMIGSDCDINIPACAILTSF